MSSKADQVAEKADLGMRFVYWLDSGHGRCWFNQHDARHSGYDDLASSLTGNDGATFRKFPFPQMVLPAMTSSR